MGEKCGTCGHAMSKAKKQSWCCCDGCQIWFHAECVGIKTDVEFELIKAKAKWFCPNCIKSSNISRVVKGLVQENLKEKSKSTGKTTDDMEKWVSDKLDAMWPQITSYCDNIKIGLREEMATENLKLLEQIGILEKRINQLTNREEHKDRRILLLYGIPDAIQIYNHTFLIKIANELGLQGFNVDMIENVVKIPNKGGGARTSTVMVFFFKQLNKNEFMSAYLTYIKDKQLNLSLFDPVLPKNRIYVNEYLSKTNHRILMEAKNMKKGPYS